MKSIHRRLYMWSVPDDRLRSKEIDTICEAVFRADGMVVVHLQSEGLMDVVRISNTLHLSDLLWENPKEWARSTWTLRILQPWPLLE